MITQKGRSQGWVWPRIAWEPIRRQCHFITWILWRCVYVSVLVGMYVCSHLRCGHATSPSRSSVITPPTLTTGRPCKPRPLYLTMRLVSATLSSMSVPWWHLQGYSVHFALWMRVTSLRGTVATSARPPRRRRSPGIACTGLSVT